MRILFVHQNFPGQFPHLARALAARGHDVRALTDAGNARASPVPVVKYRHEAPPPDPAACRLGRTYTEMSDRGVTAARAAAALRGRDYVPDVVVGHSGWGETLFLKEVWPEARLIVYAEFHYRGSGLDVGFDPEFETAGQGALDRAMIAQARAAHLAQALLQADAGLSPTQWQADSHPPDLRRKITVIFDGIDTDRLSPDPAAQATLPDGTVLRALPAVLAARPQAHAVIVGGDGVSYGRPAPGGRTWTQVFRDEVAGRLDPARVHFTGRLSYADFVALMQVTRVHAYLTYPFVLSWSMLEAMAAGALVIGSATPPVAEVIADGVNGRLVDFFDVAGWSAALAEALAEPARFAPLREAGRATVVERYDLARVCLPRQIAFVEQGGR